MPLTKLAYVILAQGHLLHFENAWMAAAPRPSDLLAISLSELQDRCTELDRLLADVRSDKAKIRRLLGQLETRLLSIEEREATITQLKTDIEITRLKIAVAQAHCRQAGL